MLNKLIENTFKNTRLKRVRVKSDPSIPPVFGYENVSCFEGYVLEECGEGMVNVYIINAPPAADPIQQVSVAQLEPVEVISATPQISDIKTVLLRALIKAGHGEETPVYNQIRNTSSIDFIKAFLAQANISIEDLMAINNESTLLPSPSADEDVKIKNKAEDIFGTREGKFDRLLKATGKGLNLLTKTVGAGAELVLGKDNIVARVNRFLKSFEIGDLVDIKKVTDRARTKDYSHLPYNNEPVVITGLPKLSYQKYNEVKYQLMGRIKNVKLSTDGIMYVVGDIQPELNKIKKILLDFTYLDNPSKVGKIIFEDVEGARFYNRGTIVYSNSVWLVKLGSLNINDKTSENKKDNAFIAASINLLKESLGTNYDDLARRPDYSLIVIEVAIELKKHNPETMAQIGKFFKEYLPKQEEYFKLSTDEKINSIRGYLKKFKETTNAI